MTPEHHLPRQAAPASSPPKSTSASASLSACLGISGMNVNEGYWSEGIFIISQNSSKSPSNSLDSSISQTSKCLRKKGNLRQALRLLTARVRPPRERYGWVLDLVAAWRGGRGREAGPRPRPRPDHWFA
jgi:hypothetical protein